jgi:hypothetical protein
MESEHPVTESKSPICKEYRLQKKHPQRIVNPPFLIALNRVTIIHKEDFITAKFELTINKL